ncbi:MAG TPA: SDR family oxidoreductase [Tepidisphaeraceae bacterium]|nr:SDR family oxidoreductase [Tepidisphaeraceae bacterium]
MNGLSKLGLTAVAVAGGAALVRTLRDSLIDYDFTDRIAVVTGGTRGLGLLLARELVTRGARVAVLGRDLEELERGVEDLTKEGGEAIGVPCDVRQREQVQWAMDHILARLGPVDILINNAGVIQVGPIDHMTEQDFQDALAIHCWAPFYTMQAVIPGMRARGEGRIVNICSIGGKIAVPHLAPYTTSKFALAGLSEAMRVELAKDKIYVTTVYPGLMRTGSHLNAMFKGKNREEFAWFAMFDALPITSISAKRAARQIINACRRGDPQMIVSIQAKLAVLFHELMPTTSLRLMDYVNRVLPAPSPQQGQELHSGWESSSKWAPSLLTRLADRATAANNELRGHTPIQ